MRRHSKLIGGILLVSGTTIGAGMLALPVSTGMAGFFPSLVLLVIYWAYMTCTAFLMLEVNLWMREGANLISMVKRTLGKWGQAISWVVYLFLLYSLTTAYIAGSGPIVIDFVEAVSGISFPGWTGTIPLLVIFGFFVYKGTRSVDYVNRILMIGLVVAYAAMVIFLTPHVNKTLLFHRDWKYLLAGVSVVATSFGFHIIIPSLATYMERDIKKLKKVILIGSIIPLIVYILWEYLALGIIPLAGEQGLIRGYQEGTNGAHLLTAYLGHSAIAMTARFFSFFAIVTSFLGVSLSLSDFLADGLHIKKTRMGRILLYFLTFLPPLIFTFTDPRAFLSALEYAGAFGVVILLGLFPALMVWWGRYHKHFGSASTFKVPGGRLALMAIILLSLLVIGIEIVIKLAPQWMDLKI
jgi:tyrosine-specific transport protein